MPIRLVVADDHPIFLNALTSLFHLEGDLDVVASCTNGTDALQAIRQHCPDVASLDIRMPGMSGLDIARTLRAENNTTRFVLLTAELDESMMLDVVTLRIEGLVLKEMAPQLLVQCIRKVHGGEQWIERNVARQALEILLRKESGAREAALVLTPREIDLVRLLSCGMRNKEIADKLCISDGTVKAHLHNIYEKLGVDGRTALLRYAQEMRLV
jgi:DNA-binding NarL/FixJ family response regulator